MKFLVLIAVFLFCVYGDDDLNFDRNEFRIMRDYMDQIYEGNPQNSTDWKWFHTDKHAYGYVAYDSARDHIMIAFRGTMTTINMFQNIKFNLIPYSICDSLNACKVHKGFVETYKTAKKYIFKNFKIFRNLHPNAKIYVTGYSLGAAQAGLCALELSLLGHQVNLMTFGSPRIGNKEFASFANNNLKGENYRVTFENDAVTALPIKAFGYHHIGTEVNFNKKNEIKMELPKYSDKTFHFRPYNLIDHLRTNYIGIN